MFQNFNLLLTLDNFVGMIQIKKEKRKNSSPSPLILSLSAYFLLLCFPEQEVGGGPARRTALDALAEDPALPYVGENGVPAAALPGLPTV